MKFFLAILATVVLSLAVVPLAGADIVKNRSNRSSTIDVAKISIGKLKLGMSESETIKVLGKPQQSKQAYDDVCFNAHTTVLKYKQREIFLLGNTKTNGRIHQIITSNPADITEAGIRVGTRLSKAKQAYGKFRAESNSKFPLVYVNEGYGGLGFRGRNGLITAIDLLATSC